MTRFSAIEICFVTILSSNLVACGDGEAGTARTTSAGGADESGGTAAIGGKPVGGQSAGGQSSSGQSAGGKAGAAAATGGNPQGGSSAGGETGTIGGSTSGSPSGGSTGVAQGGSSVEPGGASSTGGAAEAGGSGNTSGVGNTSSSQAGSTANTNQGGSSNTSLPSGGVAGTPSMGGIAGTVPVGQPCQAYFQAPGSGAVLTATNDASGQFCKNGLAYNISVVTNAPSGTPARLLINNVEQGTAAPVTVQNLSATFPLALLGSTGDKAIKVQIGTGDSACEVSEAVSVDCTAVTCGIQAPTLIADTHPALNGVSASLPGAEGDRVTLPSEPYEVQFVVNTNIGNGRPVTLDISRGSTVLTPAIAYVQDGKATFSHVQLSTDAGVDGTYNVLATCLAANGDVGVSSTNNVGDAYPVDITPPDLAITRGSGANGATMVPLVDGAHFAPADDAEPASADVLQMRICGTTTAPDAIDIVSTRATTTNNFAVGLTSTAVVRAPVTAAGNNSACVVMDCPGNAPFNLNVTLKDHAGNPQTKLLQGVTCAATAPVVLFADPVEGDDFAPVEAVTDFDTATGEFTTAGKNKIAKRILANSNVNATRKDQNPNRNGAQYAVKVCTSAQPSSGGAKLYINGSSTASATTDVVADTSGTCTGDPINQPSIATFSNVDIPDSAVAPLTLRLTAPTTLLVQVTDTTSEVTSKSVSVWVDPLVAGLQLDGPAGLCPSHYEQSDVAWTPAPVFANEIRFATGVSPVYATVQDQDGGKVVYSGSWGSYSNRIAVPNVTFPLGANIFSAVIVKPSGNSAAYPGSGSCNVSVGATPPPTVWFASQAANTNPVDGSRLSAKGNVNIYNNAVPDVGDSAGWQGTLRACTNLLGTNAAGVGLKFFANGTQIGTDSTPLGSDGCASLDATIADGTNIQLVAETTPVLAGVGVSPAIAVDVDVTPPGDPGALASDPDQVRRQTTFRLNWTSPQDGSATNYEIAYRVRRSSDNSINWSAEFDSSKTQTISSTHVSNAPNEAATLDVAGLQIETAYSFAVQAYDRAGNTSAIVSVPAQSAKFKSAELLPPASGLKQKFGYAIDASDDINGDNYSDVVVGTSTGVDVFIYFGGPNGPSLTPDVKLRGGSVNSFGRFVAIVGDVDGDTINDIAVGAPFFAGNNGAVYVFRGRLKSEWPSELTAGQADFSVLVDAASPAPTGDSLYVSGQLGTSIARLGDFNGDTHDDFAIGIPRYNSNQGQVIVVYGVASKTDVSNIALPVDAGSKVTRVNGDVAAQGRLGSAVLGLGSFFGTSTRPALVAAASNASSYLGRLYCLVGQSGTPADIAIATTAVNSYDSDVVAGAIGSYGLFPLGNVGPNRQPAFGYSFPTAAGPSYDRLYSGSAVAGPFAQIESINTTANSSDSSFGRMIAGGGISGTSTAISLIGSNRSDIVVSSRTGGVYRLFIIDGDDVSMSGSANIEALAKLAVAVPPPSNTATTLQDFARSVTISKDVNGDSFGDIAVGDIHYASAVDGRVVLLW